MVIMKDLFEQAQRYIPGGVNSPVRSFRDVGGCPVFMKRAHGSNLFDENDVSYIDFCCSWGALILGHSHDTVVRELTKAVIDGTSFGTATKKEIEFAQLVVEAVGSIEKVRLTCSGTEAVMSAIRLARAYTGKTKIIKFEGAYHGHADYLLAKAGSGAASLGIPSSPGVPAGFSESVLIAPYNDIETTARIADEHSSGLAGIIVEPIAANCGVIPAQPGFLESLRSLADKHGALLIFDEVITGFRLTYGGFQDIINVTPDLTCLGKIIGGGLPVGAFGGRADIMDMIAPVGQVYQAGTLAGNPLAVTAGITMLRLLKSLSPYDQLAVTAQSLCETIRTAASNHGIPLMVNQTGSMFSLFFTDSPVTTYSDVQKCSRELFNRFFHTMLEQGIYMSPSAFEANFISTAHTNDDMQTVTNAVESACNDLKKYV